MITLDPTQPDPFSSYVFELTNAAQTGVHGRVGDFGPTARQKDTGRGRRGSFGDDPESVERFAFHREFVEYSGTARHDRVAQAINAAGLGFTVARTYQGAGGGGYDHFTQHMARQAQAGNGQVSHTDRYREQHRVHWKPQPPQPRRLSATGADDSETELRWQQGGW